MDAVRWMLVLSLVVSLGCSDDHDGSGGMMGGPGEFAGVGQWLASPPFALSDPCIAALPFPTVPILISQVGSDVRVTTRGSGGNCIEMVYTVSGDTLVFDDVATLTCSSPPCGPVCELNGDVQNELTFSGNRFTGTMSGIMQAVPGSGCICTNSTHTRPVQGQRCSGCWPGCTP